MSKKPKKRYFRTITEVFCADNDSQALQLSEKYVEHSNKAHDNGCVLVSVVRQDFGELKETKIFDKNNNDSKFINEEII